jgi:hypothetical protein
MALEVLHEAEITVDPSYAVVLVWLLRVHPRLEMMMMMKEGKTEAEDRISLPLRLR